VVTAVHHYLDRLDADGPEPDPTEGPAADIAQHADGSISGRFDLDAVAWGEAADGAGGVVQAGRVAGDERTRAQRLAMRWCSWRQRLASGVCPSAGTSRSAVKVASRTWSTGHRPGCRADGVRRDISAARARWIACDGTSPGS
jgi:hypothetical protein